MLKTRLIPCLLLKSGYLVRSQGFEHFRNIGNPIEQVERYNEWAVDELIYLDIGHGESNLRPSRRDARIKPVPSFLELIQAVSKSCFLPLTVGGHIASIEDIEARLKLGADKIIVNSYALDNPSFIDEASRVFGSQCIVVAIDYRVNNDIYCVYSNHGRSRRDISPWDWAREAEGRGCGEIFLNSIDRDGMAQGFDINCTKNVCDSVSIPIVTCGGAGNYDDFATVVKQTLVSAVSAANIFHFQENSYHGIKSVMEKSGIDIR